MTLDPNNPLHLISATLAHHPHLVVTLPVFAPHDPNGTLVLRARTRMRRLPPELAAQLAQMQAEARGNGTHVEPPTHIEVGNVLLTIPADMAENLRGPAVNRHPVYLISVHRSAYDAAMRQAETGLVLPGSPVAGSGGIIVKP